jgi:hypothetical protein
MELLVELIVWIVKSLFGDPEKTVDTSRQSRKPAVRPQRGPYRYGDEKQAPKTLEEILAEARRQANQRKEGTAPVAPTPKVQRRVLEVQEEPPKPVRELVAKDAEPSPPSETIKWASAKAEAKAAPQPVAIQKAPEPAPVPKPKRVRKAAPQQAAAPTGVLVSDLLQAIRVASPVEKRDAARQAIVLYEVFGPPRCRRGFNAGGMLRRGR